MNLANGKILNQNESEIILNSLEERIIRTMEKEPLDPNIVISACNRLVKELDSKEYLGIMALLGIDHVIGSSYIERAKCMFSAEALYHRMNKELDGWDKTKKYKPFNENYEITEEIKPLGVLLHIAAGNMDGLPAFSVLEGLLTGNINILKLPSAEGGASVRLLFDLVAIEPKLADYIYVFDYSSKDIIHIKKLVSAADGIVVWGGSEAIAAIRTMADPNIKIIEWGHKVSFAYVTENGITREGLRGIAKNMAETSQLLCSSCQGIYYGTEEPEKLRDFCLEFLPYLEEAVRLYSKENGTGTKAQSALKVYCAELETIYTKNKIYRGENCSITSCSDNILETSVQFGNPWVKALPKKLLLPTLRPYKNFLQTIGLLCSGTEYENIKDILFKTGAVYICDPVNMSDTYCGSAHDGEYPLRRYTKITTRRTKF